MFKRIYLLGAVFSLLTASCGLIAEASGSDYDEQVFLTLEVDATSCSSATSGYAMEADRDTQLQVTNNGAAVQAEMIQQSDVAGAPTNAVLLTFDVPANAESEHTFNVPAGIYTFDCGNDPAVFSKFTIGDPASQQASAEQPAVSVDTPEVPAVPEAPAAQGQTIEQFWEQFSLAVAQKDSAAVANLSVVPLPLGETGDSLTEADFAAQFDTYFDSRLATTTAVQLEKLVMIEEFAQRYNSEVGEEIYQVGFEEGGVSQVYVFGLEGGEYKLRSIILLQQ